MSRLPAYSEAPGGGDRVYLDSLGPIRGLRLSTTVNGDQGASWQAALDPRLDHRALQPGRIIGVPISLAQAWQGVLDTPQRGTVWQFTATGTAALLDRWSAIDTTAAGNALNCNEIVDEAISRGLVASRGALPSLPAGTQPSGSLTLAAALTQVTSGLNQWWNISRAKKITAAALPTALAYLLKAQDNAGGRTVDGFVTDVTVTYLNAATYRLAALQRANTTARAKYGRFEQTLDLTGEGPLTTAQAQTRGDNYLTLNAPRLKFAGAFLVAHGQLLTPGGTPVDLATVQSGTLTQVMLTDPDTAAGELALGPVQIVGGQTDYDVDADQLTLTPLDYSPQGLAALVGSTSTGGSSTAVAYLPAPNIDRGSAPVTLTAAANGFTSVVFNQTFTVAPEVILTQASLPAGSGRLVPKSLNVTTTGFDLYCYTGDGTTTTTTVTVAWVAVG
jgi:hypothetical protein